MEDDLEDPTTRDIAEELDDWAYIIDNSKDEAIVCFLESDVFKDAAAEIRRLRKVVYTYRASLAKGEVVDL